MSNAAVESLMRVNNAFVHQFSVSPDLIIFFLSFGLLKNPSVYLLECRVFVYICLVYSKKISTKKIDHETTAF